LLERWPVWLAIGFVAAAVLLGGLWLPRPIWLAASIAVVVLGVALIVLAIKRKSASTAESVGLLSSLPNEPPSDVDAP
jgi:hypothetical protein